MTTFDRLDSAAAIASWINTHVTEGEMMRRPYKRKWEIGGCARERWLPNGPSGRVSVLAAGLASLDRPIFGIGNGVSVEIADRSVRVAADRSDPGDGPPQAYLMQVANGPVNYVGNSPEVIVELLRGLPLPPPPRADAEFIQVGFPGHEQDEVTYVGSWQWDIHGEARGAEFIDRAAAATLAAIEAAERV